MSSTGSPPNTPFRNALAAGLLLDGSLDSAAPTQTKALPERLLTVREVAKRLNLCTATVYGLVAKGDLRCVRFANVIRFDTADIVRYLNGGHA